MYGAMKRPWILFALLGAVMLILVAGFLFWHYAKPDPITFLVDRSFSFPERSAPSYDGKYELRQYSKEDEDNVNSLYFYITKAEDKNPLFVSDCEYRLWDFQYLGWGVGTYDVWAISGDVGTFCYVYQQDGAWVAYLVEARSTDEVWELDAVNDGGEVVPASQIERSKVPKEVISSMQEWEAK
jgi:hypothetical protein